MTDHLPRLRAVERTATEARRALEACISGVDAQWNDGARRAFEAEHLAAIRADARHLAADIAGVIQAAEQSMRFLGDDQR